MFIWVSDKVEFSGLSTPPQRIPRRQFQDFSLPYTEATGFYGRRHT